MVRKISLDMADITMPKFEAIGEHEVVGNAITPKHPVFAIEFAAELIDNRIMLAYATQGCTTLVTLDGTNGQALSKEPFKNDFIEMVTGILFWS